jgi:D-serine deaminase-like pyridoxal phosphate-dependent protein
VDSLGVTLRPHVKTVKSIDVLRILAGGREVPITVSTVAEARYFFERGVRDILYAVGIAPVKLRHVADLIRAGCSLRIILDSLEAAEAVAAFSASEGVAIEALIEVDTDGCRAGVDPDSELLREVAQRLSAGASLAGVMTHAGGSYSARTLGEFEAIAERERKGATVAAERLRAAGHPISIVSVGSTPTVHYARNLDGVTEARVGVYAFGDLVQAELGTCVIEDIAISVLGSVIGHQPERHWVITDAGWMALSRDRGTARQKVDQGYGLVCDIRGTPVDDLIVVEAYQELGSIARRDGGVLDLSRYPVGSRVRILPNHACATAAQFAEYQVLRDNVPVETWERFSGW